MQLLQLLQPGPYLLGNSPTSMWPDITTAVLTFIWEEQWWEIFLKTLKLFEIL